MYSRRTQSRSALHTTPRSRLDPSTGSKSGSSPHKTACHPTKQSLKPEPAQCSTHTPALSSHPAPESSEASSSAASAYHSRRRYRKTHRPPLLPDSPHKASSNSDRRKQNSPQPPPASCSSPCP